MGAKSAAASCQKRCFVFDDCFVHSCTKQKWQLQKDTQLLLPPPPIRLGPKLFSAQKPIYRLFSLWTFMSALLFFCGAGRPPKNIGQILATNVARKWPNSDKCTALWGEPQQQDERRCEVQCKQTADFFAFSGATRNEVKSKAGVTVDLPCLINQEECGDFHSIKWYKENRRVYVYSPIANFARAEGELVERGQLIFEANNATTRLQITDLKTSDEGEYKCEITFLDITKDCPVVQLIKLTTLGSKNA